MYINGKPLDEPYIEADRRAATTRATGRRRSPEGNILHDGRQPRQSCDSQRLGHRPAENLIGKVFAIYWPPKRIGFR